MLFSRRSATSACAIVLIVMAVTPYHRFSSSIGLVSGAMTWLVILGACLAAFGHGVALRKGREIRRPGRLGVCGVFLAAIAAVPEAARVRQLALLASRSLSDVQSQILLMTAEGATTKTIAEDVGYAASTVQALRSASYRQLKIKNKAELVSLLSQVDNV